jgi:uncharacterized DUF497 family protein
MEFQWDQVKADLNWKKHGVDFADAVGVFEDEWALTLRDEVVSGEERFATEGIDFLGRVLVVIYTYRGENIRIISARPPTRMERGNYDERRI